MGEPEIEDEVQVKIEGDGNDEKEQQKQNHRKEKNGSCQNQKTTLSSVDQKAGGSSCSAALTEDVESQATTTNLDESGDSETGGNHEPGYLLFLK